MNGYLMIVKRILAVKLITILRPGYEPDEISFIRKHALNSLENANLFLYCFLHDINEGSDSFFELELEYYGKFPDVR